jgi:hypothetical protein
MTVGIASSDDGGRRTVEIDAEKRLWLRRGLDRVDGGADRTISAVF